MKAIEPLFVLGFDPIFEVGATVKDVELLRSMHMQTADRIETLQSFFAYLDGLSERAAVEELRPRLDALNISLDDVADCVCFGINTYQRNLLRAGGHYHALVICWRSGQRSPIHNHANSICGVRVLSGVATETIFEPTPCGQMKAVKSRDLHTSGVCVSVDSDTHQMSNLQPAGTDLVTLHIYSPPLLAMGTYSITGEKTQEFRPIVFEHSDGSGI